MSSPDSLAQASSRVATRFTRTMNASTSPLGVSADVALAFTLSALPFVLLVRQLAADRLLSPVGLLLLLLTVLPIGASFLTNLRLRHARAEVIAWLAAQPFPIDNLNTMLIGLGDSMEVVFEPGSERGVPGRAVMQPLFDAVNDDILWTGASEETQTMTVRLGVIDSKRLPARTNYQRFMRFQQVVEDVLRPLHAAQPIARVQIV